MEGSEVLEKLAAEGLVDEFYKAVDEDNLPKVTELLKSVDVPKDVQSKIMNMINEGD